MLVKDMRLSGLKLIVPQVFGDERGLFLETYREPRYVEHGIDCRFVQDNLSRSIRGTLRGLHHQPGQAKLVRVGEGRIFDVAVDVRAGSPTFGQWEGVEIDAEEHRQLFIPVGFAHGFCVLSETADVLYKLSSIYDPETECSLTYNDPDIGIDWPVSDPILSQRDRHAESLRDLRRRLHG